MRLWHRCGETAARPQKDDDKMLTKRQQQVLKSAVDSGHLFKNLDGLWRAPGFIGVKPIAALTLYTLAHNGLIAFVDVSTVIATPKGEVLASLLDETTMVTRRRDNGVVIS